MDKIRKVEDIKAKILAGRADDEERLEYYKRLASDSEEKKAFIDLKNLYAIQMATTKQTTSLEKQKQLKSIWKKIEGKRSPALWMKIVAYAAVCVLFLSIGQIFNTWIQSKDLGGHRIVTISSKAKSINQFELADGSTISLNANSQIKILSERANEVVLDINGEAFFDIIHNENRKFIVNAGDIQIIDRGTKFNVQANDRQFVKASLLEGNIDVVTANNKVHSLVPGQQFVSDQHHVRIEPISGDASVLSWMRSEFIFRNTSLSDIAGEIEQWYGVTVKFDKKEAKDYTFSGTVDKTITLDKLMHMLSYSTSIRYQIIENTDQKTIVLIK